MDLRQNLENLPVGRKLLVALVALLTTVLLVANLVFISAAYWISLQSVAPEALKTIAELLASPALSQPAMESPAAASQLLARLEHYAPLRAAVLYDAQGQRWAQRNHGPALDIPDQITNLTAWQAREFRPSCLVPLYSAQKQPIGYLLLVASSELPDAFYSGTLTASLAILVISSLLWVLVARQVRRLVTRPIRKLEELTHRVTQEENYALRATPRSMDEIGHLAEAFNTMLARMEAREQQLRRARDDARTALNQAEALARQAQRINHQLAMEIQERSRVEKKLTGFQRYLNNIIDSMPSALIAVDEELQVTQWNQQASALSGTSLDDALNQPLVTTFTQLTPFLALIQRTAEHQQVERVERIAWMQGGVSRSYDLTFYPLVGGDGLGVVIRIDDITERLGLEDIMVQSEKMRSVGSLAAGMAHEINNPLGAILHNVQNIRRRLSLELARNQEVADTLGVSLEDTIRYLKARQISQLLDDTQQAGSRAAKIVSHMLSFSRMSNRRLTPCLLSTVIEQALDIAGNDFDLAEGFDFRAITIVKDFDERIGQVPCISNELEQVLLNLLKNAAQAIHQQGAHPGHITLRTRLNPPWAEIQVEDNAEGMPDHVRQRIFEPFFTTKEVGQGTGLGLSVSYFIITNNHKGQMEVQSQLHQGTLFTLRLPLACTALQNSH